MFISSNDFPLTSLVYNQCTVFYGRRQIIYINDGPFLRSIFMVYLKISLDYNWIRSWIISDLMRNFDDCALGNDYVNILHSREYYEKSLCLVNLCSQMDCFSMHASVDKEDMSLSFTVVSKREENIAFFFCKYIKNEAHKQGGIGICRGKKASSFFFSRLVLTTASSPKPLHTVNKELQKHGGPPCSH